MKDTLSTLEEDFGAIGVSIDTRTLQPGEAYLALQGDRLDGHDYVGVAFDAGASCAVVRADYKDGNVPEEKLVRVPDTTAALEDLGRAGRARSSATVIGVTGSAGKTGTKELLAIALSALGPAYASRKSFNNHWGVPLTLANIPKDARYAVIEMGMNHAGELTKLSALVKPQIAIVTTIEPAHIEHFKTVEAIADAKAEIFSGMEKGGTAILNLDNPHFQRLKAAAEARGLSIVTFGEDEVADCVLTDLALHADSTRATARIDGKTVKFRLNIPGKHIAMNALAALAAVRVAGGDVEKAAAAIRAAEPVTGRGNRMQVTLDPAAPPLTLIDESYNANPASMAAALSVLEMAVPAEGGRRIVVLGDMLELGPEGPQLHAALANPLLKARADLVFCCGPQMEALYNLLPGDWRGGHAPDSRGLAPLVATAVRPGDIVLVKGSAGSKMAYIIEALRALQPEKDMRHAL